MTGDARSYSEPAADYAAAVAHVAVARRTERSFIRVFGRDPVRMVQGLASNDIARASAQRAVYTAVLTPKGKMIADVRVFRRGADLLLEVDAAAAGPLMAHLRKFVPPLFARVDAADGEWCVHTVVGPAAAETLRSVLQVGTLPDAEDAACSAKYGDHDVVDDVVIVATSYARVPGFDLLATPPAGDRLRSALLEAGAAPLGSATLDVLRIEAGTPKWGAELDETVIPLEAGLRSRAISETKGCYTGQEVVVRILHRGHVNWLLRGLRLGDSPAPARGTELTDGTGKVRARVTSAAWSPWQGETIALAYVRREVEPGDTLPLERGGTAVVVELPFR
jgi:folate-binding protein YgfZ